MGPKPTKRPPSQKKNGVEARASPSLLLLSSLSSLFCSMVTPMFYIGLGILLYQHWMTTSIDASSFNMATTTATHPSVGEYCPPTATDFPVTPLLLLQQQQQEQQEHSQRSKDTTTTVLDLQQQQQQQQVIVIDPTKVIFYHLNIPETHGAYLNRYMARTYHTVCGPYAYSIEQPIDLRLEPRINPESSSRGPTPDRTKTWNEMQAIGWHNCQWISSSSSRSSGSSSSGRSGTLSDIPTAVQSVQLIHYLQQLGLHVHLVIPCPRDVVSHRLSICSAVGAPLSKWLSLTTTGADKKKKKKRNNNKKDNDDNDNDDELCRRMIHDCVYTKVPYYDETISATANSTSYFGYQDLTQVDRLVAGYLPTRGYPLPRPTATTTNTNTNTNTTTTTPSYYFSETMSNRPTKQQQHYSQHEIQEVIRRCGSRIHAHFWKTNPLYETCAIHKKKGGTLK